MTKERPEGPELILTTLDKLGKAPVTVEEIKTILPLMRVEAEGAGIKLELSKEGRESLGERQFRDLESGRGPGIVEALEQKKARGLLDWCQKNGKRKIGGKERTEGRGLQQAAAANKLVEGVEVWERIIQSGSGILERVVVSRRR